MEYSGSVFHRESPRVILAPVTVCSISNLRVPLFFFVFHDILRIFAKVRQEIDRDHVIFNKSRLLQRFIEPRHLEIPEIDWPYAPWTEAQQREPIDLADVLE